MSATTALLWGPLLLVGILLGGMLVLSFSGVAPARVDVDGAARRVRITMRGPMAVYALKRRIHLDVDDVLAVHADRFAKNLIGGLRVGTHFPGVMTAGWFYRGSGRGWDFFAVHRARSALVLDLVPGRRRFRRVIVEVADLDATAAAIESLRPVPAR